MSDNTKRRIHLLYSILVSVVVILTGVAFILSAYHLYTTGLQVDAQPYTTATIAAAFSRISPLVYLCLGLVLGGFILNLALPQEAKKPPVERNRKLMLEKLITKTDLAACPDDLRKGIEKQEKDRKIHILVGILLLTMATTLFLSYACQDSLWHETDFNGSMMRGFFALVICMALPFAYHVWVAFYCCRSMDKEIQLLRQASTLSPYKGEAAPAPRRKNFESIVRCGVLILAVAMLTYGLCTGGTVDVLAKAATICTECVGLG